MKDFFKNRTWDDYLAMIVMVLIIGGLIVFFIGFYWGFKLPNQSVEAGLIWGGSKTSVKGVISMSKSQPSALMFQWQELLGESSLNLFTLAGAISSASGALFVMVVVSLIGFSMIMLGILVMIVTIIAGFTIDFIIRRRAKKGASK